MALEVMTVVGARPQFIKAAVVSHEMSEYSKIHEFLIHTGQHYDYNMSEAFFEELSIPAPVVNLGISGGSHAEMTSAMLVALEKCMLEMGPNIVLLYGDTNSTLAAALAASKLHIPVVHVEAGARTRSKTNPEEINRVCTDHIASLLLASTETGLDNLKAEGLIEHSCFTGDPMYDAYLKNASLAKPPVLSNIDDGNTVTLPQGFYYLTCHREENTSPDVLNAILEAMNTLDFPVIYPVHPRNRAKVLEAMENKAFGNVYAVNPIGYLGSLYLVNHAKQVVTDSGGLQREAFFAGVKCTTLLDFEVWPETMVDNRNLLASPTRAGILNAMQSSQHVDPDYLPFGDGHAARNIIEEITRSFI